VAWARPPPCDALTGEVSPAVSSAEFDLLRGYLQGRSYQWRRGNRYLWIVNASVRLGDGLPAACAAWAHEQSFLDGDLEVRALNLAVDEAALRALEEDRARYASGLVMNLQGTIEVQIHHVLGVIGVEPAFVVLKSFAGEGVDIGTLERLVTRRGRRSELLLRLDAACNQDLAVSLRLGGYPYVYETSGFAGEDSPSQSRWFFATRSPAGVALMSEFVCRRARERSDATETDRSELRRAIERFGAGVGHASTTQIFQALSLERFGRFTRSECRAAVRALVSLGVIVAPSEGEIKDSEWLSFRPGGRPGSSR
jgi:hypothetical protein